MKGQEKGDKSKKSQRISTISVKKKFLVVKSEFPRDKIDKSLAQAVLNSGKKNEKYVAMGLKKWVDSIMVRVDKDDFKNLEI